MLEDNNSMETTMADKKPGSANEVLASVNDDHNWRELPEDLHSTGGIQRAIKRNADAISALADYIDGKSTRAMPGYEAPKTEPVTKPAVTPASQPFVTQPAHS